MTVRVEIAWEDHFSALGQGASHGKSMQLPDTPDDVVSAIKAEVSRQGELLAADYLAMQGATAVIP